MPIGVGIIGTGWGVNVQLPIFNMTQNMQVVAIYSRDQAKADAVAKKHNIKHAFSSVQDLVTCTDVDVVSVVSPTFLHAEHAIAAVRAGKHVLCDKPTALSASSALEMVNEAAQRPNQLAIIDHETRFLPIVQSAKAAVAGGGIGEIWHADVVTLLNFGHFGRSFSWWNDRNAGGGVIGAVGVHMIDLLAFISGTQIKSINATCSVGMKEKPDKETKEMKKCTAAEHVSAHFSLSSGASGSLTLSSITTAQNAQYILIVGSLGTLTVDLIELTFTLTDRKGKLLQTEESDFSHLPKPMQSGFPAGTVLLADAIAKAAAGDKTAIESACTFGQGAYVQSVVDAIWQSSDTSTTIPVGDWEHIKGKL